MSHQNDHFCFVITTMAIFSDFFSAGLLSLFTFKTFVSSLFQVQFSISFNTIFEETTAVRQGGTSLLIETKFQLFFGQSSSLLWCPVFKSASSSWTFHIIALSGCLFPPCVISVGSLARFIPHICQLWGTTAVFCPV